MKRKLDWRLRSLGCDVLFEDDALLVLDKPPNLLVLPDRFNNALPNLYTTLCEELGSLFVVHRIDKETSGVILFAKTAEAHAQLNTQFEGRAVEKVYQAIVLGEPESRAGTIDLPLSESSAGTMKVDRKKGKESVTDYTVLEQFRGYAWVELRPKTGRQHQIRVHLQAMGTPIVGDSLYGNGRGFYLSMIKPGYRNAGEEKPLVKRTALHAASLTFQHPVHGERTTFTSPLPKDLRSALKYLRKFRSL
jgi:RluA family pseudouridine synthase